MQQKTKIIIFLTARILLSVAGFITAYLVYINHDPMILNSVYLFSFMVCYASLENALKTGYTIYRYIQIQKEGGFAE